VSLRISIRSVRSVENHLLHGATGGFVVSHPSTMRPWMDGAPDV
jgi:hypothetical protein